MAKKTDINIPNKVNFIFLNPPKKANFPIEKITHIPKIIFMTNI